MPNGSQSAYSTANQWQDFTNLLSSDSFDFSSNIKVFPNPSSGEFFINSDSKTKTIIYDATGKFVTSKNIDFGTSKIDFSSYSNGIYLMKIINESNQTKTIKLVKQ